MDYAHLRLLHIGCAGISITLFALRGALQFAGVDWRRWRWLRIAPHVNDTVLLVAAIGLTLMSHQYPIQQQWLSAKVIALLVYIALGHMAFRAGAARSRQALAFGAALATVAYIVAVAINRSASAGAF
jgi:uncharacterized membrane protein SirB2